MRIVKDKILLLPAGPDFRIEYEIKNVVTAVAKTHHYWTEHRSETEFGVAQVRPLPTGTTIVFDPYSGTTGEMVLGALIDLGLDVDALEAQVRKLLPTGWSLAIEPAAQNGIYGTRVRVLADPDQPLRSWGLILASLDDAPVPEGMKVRAQAMIQRIAGPASPDDGPVEAIVAILGAAAGFELLGIQGAWTNLVRAEADRFTPTGAAILGALAPSPVGTFRPARVGMGFGTEPLPWPDALRIYLCE